MLNGFVPRVKTKLGQDYFEYVYADDPDAREHWCFDTEGFHLHALRFLPVVRPSCWATNESPASFMSGAILRHLSSRKRFLYQRIAAAARRRDSRRLRVVTWRDV